MLSAGLPAGWVARPGGDCATLVVLAPGELITCTVEVTRLEARTSDDTDRFVRVRVDGIGVTGSSHANLTLTEAGGAKTDLATKQMWGQDTGTTHVRDACPGVGAEPCDGEVAYAHSEPTGPHDLGPDATLSVEAPAGTIATFDRSTCRRGRIERDDVAPSCHVRIVAPQQTVSGADAAVHLHVDWDTGRAETALPTASFQITNPNTGQPLLSTTTSELAGGTDYAVGLVAPATGAGLSPMLSAGLPAGWVARPGGDCATLVVLAPGELITCTVEVTRLEAYPVPRLTVADASVIEGQSGTSSVPVSVTLDARPLFPVTVTYATADGSATAPSDYTAKAGVLTIPAGARSATISIATLGDTAIEPTETFLLRATAVQNASIADGQATITIVNDDDIAPPVIASKGDVVVETKDASVRVFYTPPSASDAVDGKLTPTCTPSSGSIFSQGTTIVRCAASDRSGNKASSTFSVIVRSPTIAGAVFDPKDMSTPLASAPAGSRVEIRVQAGAFAPRAIVHVSFVDATGERFDLRSAAAMADGSLTAVAVIPRRAAVGPGQVTAESGSTAGEYDRAWTIHVTQP
jgi:hypothetical protein